MEDLIEIRWHGRGGQGVVTAGKLLAETALGSGQYFQAFPDYGPERMGAPIRAFTRLSPQPITIHSQIEAARRRRGPRSHAAGRRWPVTEGLKEDGTLLVNTSMSPAEVREATGFRSGQGLYCGRQPHRHRGDGPGDHQHAHAGRLCPGHGHLRHRGAWPSSCGPGLAKTAAGGRRGQRAGHAARGRRSARRLGERP